MKILKQITEDEVIAEFLKSEINSKRFGKRIVNALKNKSKRIITTPDLENKKENQFRRNIFGEVRGFGRNKDLFENFPTDIKWFKAVIEKQELTKVKYIDYSYWNEISNKTRLPAQASKNIRADVKIFNVSNKGFWEILSEIKKGKIFPYMILVSKNKKSRLVVLEGHARLTAYFLEQKYIPKQIEIIIGFSDKMIKWDLY
ncbi:MAG: hypothetical protein AABX29_00700 [Nanoarchaeota archaeon]